MHLTQEFAESDNMQASRRSNFFTERMMIKYWMFRTGERSENTWMRMMQEVGLLSSERLVVAGDINSTVSE